MKTLLGNLGIALLALAGITVAPTAMAIPSICDATAGNIVLNCGFEDGVHTSGANLLVPNDWTSNAAFDAIPNFNQVQGFFVNSGSDALQIGNLDSQPPPVLTQSLTDVLGGVYSGSIFVQYGGHANNDPLAFFDVTINGVPRLSLDFNAPNAFTQYNFSFVGTGSDVLGLTANTNPSFWYADDVVVTLAGPGPGPAPEPATLALLGLGLASLGFSRRRKLS